MFDVKLMRKDGMRLAANDVARQPIHAGEFVMDVAPGGAKRLRLRNPWAGGYEPVELYEPVLVGAQSGVLRLRGYERVGEQGLVQEWYARARR